MGDLIHMRDFKTREEREAEIGRLGMAIVSEALNGSSPAPDDLDAMMAKGIPLWKALEIWSGMKMTTSAYTAPDQDSA